VASCIQSGAAGLPLEDVHARQGTPIVIPMDDDPGPFAKARRTIYTIPASYSARRRLISLNLRWSGFLMLT
jgi:hypothetical protein